MIYNHVLNRGGFGVGAHPTYFEPVSDLEGFEIQPPLAASKLREFRRLRMASPGCWAEPGCLSDAKWVVESSSSPGKPNGAYPSTRGFVVDALVAFV